MVKSPGKTRGPKKQPEQAPPAAFAIYKASGGKATGAKIAKELRAAGHRVYTPQAINRWKRVDHWDEKLSQPAADASEDVRHSLSIVRVPEDLKLVEQASIKLFAVGIAAADNIQKQLSGIKVTTAAEFEQYARALTSILDTHFQVAKGMEELARRRIGAFTDGGAEITPPKSSHTPSTQAEVVSRFTEARQNAG